jgi:hypothetical protein
MASGVMQSEESTEQPVKEKSMSIKSQKTAIFIVDGVRTSNLTLNINELILRS